MSSNSEETAQRIAEQGREALAARLRPAFEDAVSAHADVLSLNSDQVEQMVQQAADRADGLQWRRVLASIATEELGISLGEALGHPIGERAQEILGAPSYEASLVKLGLSLPPRRSEEDEHTEPRARSRSGQALAPADDDGPLHLEATHVGGIASLQAGENGLELRFGSPGLDIARKPGVVLGRLHWREINTLEVSSPKGLRRRKRSDRANLVIRTEHGDATFEIPSVSEDELRSNIEPLLERYSSR